MSPSELTEYFANEVLDPCGLLVLSILLLQSAVDEFTSLPARCRHLLIDLADYWASRIKTINTALTVVTFIGVFLLGPHIGEEMTRYSAVVQDRAACLLQLQGMMRRPRGPRPILLDVDILVQSLDAHYTKQRIADSAGVSRMTVYRYLNDDVASSSPDRR
jgi:hypothetical protein